MTLNNSNGSSLLNHAIYLEKPWVREHLVQLDCVCIKSVKRRLLLK